MNFNSSYKSNLILIKKIFSFFTIIVLITLIESCAVWDPADVKDTPVNVEERAQKALEEGKGIKLGELGSSGGGTFEFATSNVMWRATLETLEFLPLANVDYGGGIISTDWYNEGTSNNESIKITVRFLSNEIRADGLKIIVHKKICSKAQNCTVNKISSILEQELAKAILREATLLENEMKNENRKAYQKKYGKRRKKINQDNIKN